MSPDLTHLANTRFDLVIVGGGIHGAATARDAASRGMRVALLEKDDFAASTSGASSKLVHGGLRYLQQMQWRLVREGLREREILLRTAPHLVRPLPFLIPVTPDSPHGRWALSAGLTLYDLLARGSSLERHRRLSVRACQDRDPALVLPGMTCGFLFHDAQMNDARLVLENCLAARAAGAQVWNRMEVRRLLVRNGRVHGVGVRDGRSGQEIKIEAGLVVNASGPWLTRIEGMQSLTERSRVQLSRGSHIVVPPLTRGTALLLRARADGRVFFVLPWKGNSLVGTTEVAHAGPPDDIHATEEEIRYLLDELAHVFPASAPVREDVLSCYAGVRTLPQRPGRRLGEISREAQIRLECPGLLGVLGGKFTSHRATAEAVVDRALHLLQWEFRPCATQVTPLPGGDIPDMNDYFHIAEDILVERYRVDVEILRYWVGTYGTRHTALLQILDEDPGAAEVLEPGLPFTRAEVRHAVQEEWAASVDDLIWRRTYRGFLGPLSAPARARWEEELEAASRTRC